MSQSNPVFPYQDRETHKTMVLGQTLWLVEDCLKTLLEVAGKRSAVGRACGINGILVMSNQLKPSLL